MTTHLGESGGDSASSVELRGRVKWFNAVKGYGFLALDGDDSDAFLHVTTLRQSGHEDLKPGATVVCAGVRGPKGWQVMRVLGVDAKPGVGSAGAGIAAGSGSWGRSRGIGGASAFGDVLSSDILGQPKLGGAQG